MEEMKPVNCGCGGEAKIDKHTYYRALPTYGVRCHRCGQETRQFYKSEAEAVTAWNRAMGAKDINVPDKERTAKVKKKRFLGTTTNTIGDFTSIGLCGNCDCEVNEHYAYCPSCGCRLEWK